MHHISVFDINTSELNETVNITQSNPSMLPPNVIQTDGT